MSPVLIFFYGFALLIIFGWYLFTDSDRVKRNLGTLLTAALLFLCIQAVNPPKDKIQLGLDLKGGVAFTLESDIQLFFRRAKGWATIAGDPRRELQSLADVLLAGDAELR